MCSIKFAHVAKYDRKKLDVKSRKCILLGYGTETKGFRLYDLKHAKVLYSRDVISNESSRGIEEPNEEEKKNERPYAEFRRLPDQEPNEQPVADELIELVLSRPERDRSHLTTMENGQLSQALDQMNRR